MPPVGYRNITVFVDLQIQQALAKAGAFGAAFRQVGGELYRTAATGDATMRRLGQSSVVAGAAIGGAFALSAKSAIGFEQQMRNVSSLFSDFGGAARGSEEALQRQEDAFRSTSEQVVDLSRRFPQSAQTLASGLYDIASSGFAGADSMTVLRASTLSASAGLTSTAVASKGITAVLNAYGMSAGSAADVSDILFQTLNLGVLTFEDLAANIGDVVGSAAAAGVSFDQVGAGMATITLSGISAAEASTSLNRVFQSFIDPSDAMREALRKIGFESGVTALQSLGLRGVMEKLRESTGGNIEEWVKLFPEIRAARGALALTANEGKNAARVFDEITDIEKRAGAAQRVYNEQSKTTAVQLGLTKSAVSALAIETGTLLLPAIRETTGWVTAFAGGLADLPDGAQLAVLGVGLLAGAVLTLGGGFVLLAPKIADAKRLFAEMAETSPRLASGLSKVATVTGVLSAALTVGAIVLAAHTKKKQEATEAANDYAEAIRRERDGVKDATDQQVLNDLAAKNANKTIDALGLSYRDVVDAVLGGRDALDSLSVSMLDQLPAALQTAKNQQLLREALGGSDKAMAALRTAFIRAGVYFDENSAKTLGLVQTVGDLSDAHSGGAMSVRDMDKAQRQAGVGADDTRKQMAALDAIFRDTATSAGQLTARQQDIAKSLSDTLDPIAIYRSALDDKLGSEKRSYSGGADSAEEAMRRQEQALEETQRIRQRGLEDQLDAERDAYDERRRLTDAEIDDARRLLEERFRGVDRALDDERDALGERAEVASRAFEDERTELERRHRLERDALVQGTGETRDAFEARRRLLDDRQQAEKDAYDDRKRLADRAVEDERRALEERTEQSRLQADDEKRLLDDRAAAQKEAFDDEKRLMDDRQKATKAALDDKDRAEKENLEAQKDTLRQGKADWTSFKDDVALTLREYTDALEQQTRDQQAWYANLMIVAAKVGPDVAKHLMSLGRDAAPLVAEFARASEADATRAGAAIRDKIGLSAEQAAPLLELGFAIAVEKARQGAMATVDSVASALSADPEKVIRAAELVGINLIGSMLTGMTKAIAGSKNVFQNWDPKRGYTGPRMMAAGGTVDRLSSGAAVWSMPTVVAGEGRGAESYIPHHAAYRSTAVPVLHHTARALGFRAVPMADGGMVGPAVPVSPTIVSTATVANAIDYRKLGNAVADAFARSGVGSVLYPGRGLVDAVSPTMRESIRQLDRSQR